MLKIGTCKELEKIKDKLPTEIVTKCLEVVNILDDSYGSDRDVDTDMGGFVAIIENLEDINILATDNYLDLTEDVVEDIEIITIEDKTYISILYMLSSDYGINVIVDKEILSLEILNKLEV